MRYEIVFASLILTVPLALASGCKSVEQKLAADTGFAIADIGRNAAITLLRDLHSQELIREGKTAEALRYLDSTYLYQLTLLREFDDQLVADERHVRLRNRIVEKLQRQWLQTSPEYLDEESAEYLKEVCDSIPECPKGRVKPVKPLPDLPDQR